MNFVIIIANYNNEKYIERCLLSAISQSYTDFRIIITDDASTDASWQVAIDTVSKSSRGVTLIQNPTRMGALYNQYNMIHNYTRDNEIVIILDGDDMLYDNEVLNKLNKIYLAGAWMTYGQYITATGIQGHCAPYDQETIDKRIYRARAWGASHLRSFYAWLFKRIEKVDLQYDCRFFPMCADLVTMFPMLEMSGSRARFVSDVLYVYNDENPISDCRVDRKLQEELDLYIRAMPIYERLK